MKQSFKFIYIIAIVVVIAIVVTMGIFIMNSSIEFVDDIDLSKYNTNEFNSTWKSYEGLKKGTAVKAMLTRMKANAEENKDDAVMLVDVAYNTTAQSDFNIIESTTKNPNLDAFDKAMEEIVVKHTYTVELVYNEKTGLVNGILIKNGRNDKFEFVPNET